VYSFALPPMSRLARRICHNLANAYNLSSKSYGSGDNRFTILFKTTSTAATALNEHKINAIIKRAGRADYSQNSGAKWDGTNSPHRVKRHKDGDIVGGDAKEIPSDNRGRVMLEKLGWRSGMGLGAEGMGMKLPVFAVVKSSKSGLQ
jgi:R3H domain/G-patch domain